MRNQKGSTSVLLVLILAAMLALVGAFIYAAKAIALKSFGDGLFDLAGSSVLSEFDLDLKDKYGLFGFYGLGSDVENKLRYYIDYSLAPANIATLKAVKVNTGEHSLGSVDVLEKEILNYMKYAIAKDLLKEKEDHQESGNEGKDRVLRNKKIINGLPSTALKGDKENLIDRIKKIGGSLTSVEEVFREGSEAFLINQYIISHFKNEANQENAGETFFSDEVEYILHGDYSNEDNRKGIENALVTLRTTLNASHIYADKEKRTATLLLAEAMTPGPEALLTQIAIIGTWSFAEAKNDAALLKAGKRVPFIKDDASWATDLDAVMNNTGKDYIEPAVNKGLTYEKYLMIFLHFQDKGTKLTRLMDVIQINMKGNYNGDFLIKEYNIGFEYQGKINNNEHRYKINY